MNQMEGQPIGNRRLMGASPLEQSQDISGPARAFRRSTDCKTTLSTTHRVFFPENVARTALVPFGTLFRLGPCTGKHHLLQSIRQRECHLSIHTVTLRPTQVSLPKFDGSSRAASLSSLYLAMPTACLPPFHWLVRVTGGVRGLS